MQIFTNNRLSIEYCIPNVRGFPWQFRYSEIDKTLKLDTSFIDYKDFKLIDETILDNFNDDEKKELFSNAKSVITEYGLFGEPYTGNINPYNQFGNDNYYGINNKCL